MSSLGDEASFFRGPVGGWFTRILGDSPEVTRYRTALHARGHRNFAGAVQPDHWGWFGAAFLVIFGGAHGDHRNWPAIEAWWAAEIARELRAT